MVVGFNVYIIYMIYIYNYIYIIRYNYYNERVCRDIKSKSTGTGLGWFLSNVIKHHFHITT